MCEVENHPCDDCGVHTVSYTNGEPNFPWEWYMVNDEIWVEAGMPMDPEVEHSGWGYLCIGCLEQRIGRRLTKADFTDAPVNWPDPVLHAPRLLERLTA